MGKKYERYKTRFKRRFAELPYREVNRKNLDRIGDMVLQCMGTAGDTSLPEKWHPMLDQIENAHSENPQHLVIVLWRVLCGFSISDFAYGAPLGTKRAEECIQKRNDELEPEKKPPANHLEYWTERLAELELLEHALLLDVEANEQAFAVPVGKLRRGGHIEFLAKRQAEKAFKLLSGKEGFPNLRVVTCRDPVTGKPMRYYELLWGDPPPFNGCDWCEPICALLLGIHYGYRSEAIADQVEYYQKTPRRVLDRKTILTFIEATRKQCCEGP